ncbi:hypothetical protein T492DRAFT_1030719 [Pavlovales sp. CCMP2436]|nr:hypothetical protein T492DRAFT_1030719 [Pavlovales sp. CCMP2436]
MTGQDLSAHLVARWSWRGGTYCRPSQTGPLLYVPSRSGSRTSHTRKYQARAGQGAWSRTGLIGAALQVSSSCCADGMGVPIFGQICSIADPPRADESRGGCGFQAGGRVGHSEAQVMRRISGGAGYQRSIQLPLAADQGAADAHFASATG